MPQLHERNRAQSESAPVTAVLALDRDDHEHAELIAPHNPQLKDYLRADDAMRLELGRFSAALQTGHFILAVRAAGLHAGGDMTLRTHKIGERGLVASVQGLGTMGMTAMYGTPDEAEAIRTVHRAVELGVTMFDTADMYGPFSGEELLGRALMSTVR
ncbi:aldo/keto reductase [Streptomyces sp. NPDC007896]|uniref:aldo/keto reductase n=1 Tax=Streptomyces sp. NPDC007896 TaxID=3364784 RepID=UPI0036EC2D1C